MKIFTDNAVYVQKHDMIFINSLCDSIPASIFLKVFGSGITIIDDRNRYEFIKFEEPENIQFFASLDWIIDYNDIKDLTEEQLLTLGCSTADEQNQIAHQYNEMVRRGKFADDLDLKYNQLNFKMCSLRDFIMFKRGELDIQLPQELKPTIVDVESIESQASGEDTPSKRENPVKRFLKRLGERKNK